MKPLIGITADVLRPKFTWSAPLVGQNTRYVNAVFEAGGIPVMLPPSGDRDTVRQLFGRLDGILFSGGGDIDPAQYGADPTDLAHDIQPSRDAAEIELMRLAIANDTPVLAICRGHQILNVALGGTLYQDLPTQHPRGANHDISTQREDGMYIAHHLTVTPDSKLAAIIGSHIDVNSHHHQAIDKVAPGLNVTSRAEDDIVESVELASARFTIGVQFHPESFAENSGQWRRLFTTFVSASRDYASADSNRSSSRVEVVDVAQTFFRN